MDEKQTSRMLFKKLSALRATLSDEEQALLDELLTGEHEVSGHKLNAAVAARTVAAATDDNEVSAHRMSTAAVAARAAAAVTSKDEAMAHRLNAEQSRLAFRVTFNNNEEIYTVE